MSDKYPKIIVATIYPKIYPPVGENNDPDLNPAKIGAPKLPAATYESIVAVPNFLPYNNAINVTPNVPSEIGTGVKGSGIITCDINDKNATPPNTKRIFFKVSFYGI